MRAQHHTSAATVHSLSYFFPLIISNQIWLVHFAVQGSRVIEHIQDIIWIRLWENMYRI